MASKHTVQATAETALLEKSEAGLGYRGFRLDNVDETLRIGFRCVGGLTASPCRGRWVLVNSADALQ